MDKKTFIVQVAPCAIASSSAAKLLPSLTIAQSVIEAFKEDGSGLTMLADSPNFNIFGIKGVGPAGSGKFQTHEWNGTELEPVEADFRLYHSWEESIADHTELLSQAARYANLIGEADFDRAAYLIYKDGYATNPEYPKLLRDVYDAFDLGQYDKPDECPEWARGARDLLAGYGVTDGTRPNEGVTRAEVWTMLNRLWWAMTEKWKQDAAITPPEGAGDHGAV